MYACVRTRAAVTCAREFVRIRDWVQGRPVAEGGGGGGAGGGHGLFLDLARQLENSYIKPPPPPPPQVTSVGYNTLLV